MRLALRNISLEPMWRSNLWLLAPLAGTLVGAVVLGIGGRMAMRVITIAANGLPAFTLGGTMTVVWLGAVSGAAGGLILAVVARLLRKSRLTMYGVYAVVLLLITLRGLSPASALSIALFVPLVVVYAFCLIALCRGPLAASASRPVS